jgi:hypothetical protein
MARRHQDLSCTGPQCSQEIAFLTQDTRGGEDRMNRGLDVNRLERDRELF